MQKSFNMLGLILSYQIHKSVTSLKFVFALFQKSLHLSLNNLQSINEF